MSNTWVWTGVLCDWSCGMAVVQAGTMEDAYQKVREANESGDLMDYEADELLSNEPRILGEDEIKTVWGGG